MSAALTGFSLTTLSACTGAGNDSAIAEASYAFALEKVWEANDFYQPESVLSIAGHPWIYISNVNGDDNAGFVSRVSTDGKIDTLKWVDGIQTPTGMGYFEGQIYLADQTQIHIIDLATGRIEKTLVSDTAKGLNDIAVTDDGRVFISDLTGSAIYTIENEQLTLWVNSNKFAVPNGVLIQGDSLIVGNVGTVLKRKLDPEELGAMYAVNIADKSITQIPSTDKMGSIDGIVELEGGLISTDPLAGKMFYTALGQTEIISNIGGAADIGADIKTGIIYTPFLFENKVTAYTLVKENWDRITTKAEYLEKAADNYYGEAEGKSVATSDGQISGNFAGQTLTGTWEWEDEFFCRKSTLGDMDLGYNCIVIDVTPSKMRLTLDKGTGPSVTYDKQ